MPPAKSGQQHFDKIALLKLLTPVLSALIGAIGAVIAAWIAVAYVLPNQQESYPVRVLASTYPFRPTPFVVERGDEVEIVVVDGDDTWNCGLGVTGPEGYRGERRAVSTLDSANLCELIVSFHPDEYHRVGAYGRFTAPTSGPLYLGANDDLGCQPVTSCYYDDNEGDLSVRITITRQE